VATFVAITLLRQRQRMQEGQKPPYDWDKYAQAFFPKAEELAAEAEKAEQEGNKEKASEFYLYVHL